MATVYVSPNVLAIGQLAAVTGNDWPAGYQVAIGVGRPGFGVEEWLASAQVAGTRSFATTIALGARWENAGQLVLTALIPGGKTAATVITVVPTAGRITPMGLDMSVSSYATRASSSYKLNSEGWQPGSVVHISVVSADGSINTEVATVAVGAKGALQASFFAAAAWAGRSDLGVRATTLDGLQYSLRYLPLTDVVKVRGTSNTYNVTGLNWPGNARVQLLVYDPNSKYEQQVVKTLVTDVYGAFNFTIDLPRIPSGVQNDVELRAVDLPYNAVFDF